MDSNVPPELFFGHVEKLKQTWSDKSNYAMDSIILINGKGGEGNEKTVAIVSWFLAGYNLADTIIAFTPKSIIIYTSDRKITFLSNIRDHPTAKKFNLTFIAKTDDFKDSFKKIWSDLHSGISNPKIGLLLNDSKTGQIAQEFTKFLSEQKHQSEEILPFFNQCFMTKDSEEIQNMKKSSKVSAYFFSKFIKEVEVVIDTEKATKHSDMSKKIQEMMQNEAELKKCSIKLANNKIVKDFIDVGPVCNIQSGGSFTNKLFVESNDKELKSDCIILGLSSLYRSYNSYIARTLLIDPNEEQKKIYKQIDTLSKIIIQNLRVDIKISDIYKKAKIFMADNLPNLETPKSFGAGIGIFLVESNLSITESNDRVIKPGFAFFINVCFNQIKYQSKKGTKTFAVQLIDNVIVVEKGQEILTSEVSKVLSEISYSLQEDEEAQKKAPKPKTTSSSNIIEGSRRRRVQEVTTEKLKNQKERNEHQAKLKLKKFDEMKERIHENFNGDFKKQKTIEINKIDCYKSRDDLPKDLKKNLIYIDNKNNSILLPINGSHVPFHICILKSVVKNDEGKHASLRFNFHLPNTVGTINFPKFQNPTVFIKELVFRSQQISRITELQKQVKALQKKVRTETSQKNAKEDIVQQQRISLNKGKRPILRDLYARPGIGQKKVKGNLECHLNGFRYSTVKGQIIDVAFSNIKFAFFQPCEKQIIAAIHFRLNEPIMVGKKKTEDVQFYSEGGTVSEDVVGRGRGEDSDDEERQKQAKKRIDRDFLAWSKACDEFTNKAFEFQVPKRNQGFYGTTYRSNVLLQPTKSCLINITEPHFFVFCLDDIEVVWFERMTGNVRYFDMTLVHKDYEKNIRINSISIKDVEKVKDWLDDNEIIFYDNKVSINWSKFLAGVRSDFKKFVEDGAWTAWDSAEDEEGQGQSEGDSEFSASSEELQEQSQQSQGSESDFEAEKDDSSDGSEGSAEDEDLSQAGLSWDEMEEKAEREDRERVKRELEKEKEKEKFKKKR